MINSDYTLCTVMRKQFITKFPGKGKHKFITVWNTPPRELHVPKHVQTWNLSFKIDPETYLIVGAVENLINSASAPLKIQLSPY